MHVGKLCAPRQVVQTFRTTSRNRLLDLCGIQVGYKQSQDKAREGLLRSFGNRT